MLQDEMDMPVNDAPADEGDGAPRQSYNFAPGYYGVVYRADVPDRGAGTSATAATARSSDDASAQQQQQEEEEEEGDSTAATHPDPTAAAKESEQTAQEAHQYKLQSMKWGLVPFWTKGKPSYPSLLRTINCRDDSLATPGGMWASMKARKRCVVLAEGFYEWLKRGPAGKERIPHYVRRKDGKLMCFAGLWDCVTYDDGETENGEGPLYTYTVITTDSNAQLKFLHDRMPVILEPGSEALWTWLDPARTQWSKELQAVLRPFAGELEVYPVSKEVGKVGNNSPSFVIPVASRENKANIANFFANAKGPSTAAAGKKGGGGGAGKEADVEVEVKKEEEPGLSRRGSVEREMKTVDEVAEGADDGGMSATPKKNGIKREADSSPIREEPPAKRATHAKPSSSPTKGKQQGRGKISATSNAARSPAKAKAKADGSQKITKFFGNSA
jgi:putative SOS response-associated peptidase YedK